MKPITIAGVRYRSVAEAHREESPEGLSYITVVQRLKLGWHPVLAIKMKVVKAADRRKFKVERDKLEELVK